ncbi:hypothetical protein VTP01DRAFT_4141 [Rhizomucor pusillus]|uniref:uncharacterized protein n=1 Tax=Rhizomucor pusillus TaxID=4840 RepID=UPI0037420D32
MWCTFMAYSYILRPPTHMNDKRTNYAVFWLGLGSLLGWPFSGAIGIPFLIEELLVYGRETVMSAQGHAVQFVRPANWRVQRLMRLAKAVAFSGAVISIPIVLIDWFFYRRPLFVPLNIVLYNVFGGEGQGPDIFGTEPWYYYIVNGFLNFNILFLFALGSAPLVLVASYVDRERVPGSSKWDAAWPYILLGLKLIPFYIWFGIFTLQPHKEERFLYVAYPFIALNAAISIFLIRGWTSRVARSLGASVIVRASIIRYISFAILAVFGLISVSRIVAVTTRYRAPITIYGRLWQERAPDQIVNLNYLQENYPYDASLPEINVCVGKEWFRYPGSYFLPGDARLQFIESDFKGMLPKPFTPEDIVTKKYEEKGQEYAYRTRQLKFEGARNAQIGFNSYNKADPLGYVDIDKCDYLVDADYPLRPQSPHEPGYIKDTKNWEIVACEPFLDAENSNQLSRAFFVPGSRGLAWGDYCLLKKRS